MKPEKDIILDKEENEAIDKAFNDWLRENDIEPEKKDVDTIEEI